MLCRFGQICAVEKFSLEYLHGYHSKYKVEQHVDNQYVEHIFE